MRTILTAMLVCGLIHAAQTLAGSETAARVDAILRANQLAVGPLRRTGTLIDRYVYSGDGLSGEQSQTVDLATGAYIVVLDTNILHTADGYDGRTPWMRDLSGANTPQQGGDRIRVAISAAYRNANLWWRADRGGADIDDLGQETLAGAPADHLAVRPRGGVPFHAWFDASTHMLVQITEPHMFFNTRTLFSDYRPEAHVMLPHRILADSGTGEAGYEHLNLQSASVGPPEANSTFACPHTPLTGVTLAGGAASTSVPFRLLNNHIYVEGHVNGVGPYTFIVDTGGHTLLSAKVIAEAKLASQGNAPESGAGEGQSSTGFARVQKIAIGDVEMHDQTAFAAEIYSPEIEGIAVDGMVGFELFRRLIVQIDYGRRVLTFTQPTRRLSQEAGVAIPFAFYDHEPFVRGRIDEIPATFNIDTGSRSQIDVTAPTVTRDHLRDRYPGGIQAVTGWGVGGPSRSYVVRLHSISLGAVGVNAPVADLSTATRGSFSDANYDGNIGTGLLKQFVVTFDYGHQTMYLKRIEPVPADIGDFDRSGLWLNAAQGGYVVTSVAEGSPAAEAGLHAGDVILELDGQPAVTEHLSDARERLRARSADPTVTMRVRQATVTRRVTLTLRDQIW